MYYPGGAPIEDRDDDYDQDRTKIKMKISFCLFNPTLLPPVEFKSNEDECQNAKIIYFYKQDLDEHEK